MTLRGIASEPLVHFLLLGAALFGAYGWLNRHGFGAPDEILVSRTKPVAFSPSPTPVRELLEGVVGVFDEKLSKQEVRLHLDVDPQLPEAWVDATQVEQALIEIMANALEAMPSGGSLSLAAHFREHEANRSAVEVAIADTGEGIPDSAIPRVTEPFFTTKADGTGLGLAIAKRFVEQNKGKFGISSMEKKGTVVTISLPVGEPVL